MKKLILLSLFTLHSFVLLSATPTILSTDIAGDIDDTWALAHLLRSPELDLKLVLTETGDSHYRATVAAKLLEVANRTDVQVALGIDSGPFKDSDKHQGPWVKNYDLSTYPGTVHQDGVQAFIDYVKNSPAQEINVIAIGPAPSLAAAVTQAPEIAKKCKLYGMHGSFDVGYGGNPSPTPEYNVYADVPAFRALMAAPWKSITLTPLDTCGTMLLDGQNYHAIWSATDDPLLRSVIENYCIWAPRVPWMDCDFFTQKTSTLFDDVAVLMSYSDNYINYEDIQFSVSDEGATLRDPDGPYRARVAITWKDLPAFQTFLTNRLLQN
ncbi:Inosine-uridine preferring nucleoside hydrolase superfamily [Verrucomicrobiia bacterium DG1235]|nr:Inosine-uridine preferring nucleoside hydrolase superfamily [Verrucomicrobiae bacterium DG1235]